MNPSVTARVLAPGGWPVEHAVLTLTDAAGRQVGRTTVDSAGRAAIAQVSPGAYTLIISAPGHQPVARSAVVGAGGLDLGEIQLTTTGDLQLPEPGVWDVDPVHSSVHFRARHLGLASVRGRIAEFSGAATITEPAENSVVEVTLKADSVDTGNADRDTHLRSKDFLHTEAFPEIGFRSKGLRPRGQDRWAMDSELTIRGVTRQVVLDLTYLGVGPDPWGGTRAAFHAVTELRREDFAIDWNQAVRVGIGVIGGILQVELDVELVRR
ncbi:YceI family protein [Actinoallomurus sp. NBC_01490]|uniref:YceI family protein n=1 Tax=Actinoallomurus sp. NBC_01490 TaxID=2903557 RepID=UPI002E37D429|nr:YceI family protein [Actinoallomurus sp. NBC_01490]